MNALHGVLHRHRGDAAEAGQQRGRRVGIRERAISDGKAEKAGQQRHLGEQQNPQRWPLPRTHGAAEQPRQRDHDNEFGQRENLADDAVAAMDQRRAQGHEVSGDVSDEQSLQAEEAGGVDKAAVERQQCREHRRAARPLHGCRGCVARRIAGDQSCVL